MSKIRHFKVPEEWKGHRLDRCLAGLCEEWTRSRIRRWIDEGLISRNGLKARPAERVNRGDLLEIRVPETRSSDVLAEEIPLEILYEDSDLLVLNKPSALVIHPAAGNPSGTLVNALLHHCKDLSGIGGVERPGIVHRLDKDTTGAMVVAKNDSTHLALSIAFSRREVHKTYLALCYGITQAKGVIDAPIGRHKVQRKQMAISEKGQPARTLYTREEVLDGLSLVSCRLITGRTHQIRVHMASIGHALVGDQLYSGRQWRNLPAPEHLRLCRDFPRQALHSRCLEFTHPGSGETLKFEAPLPADFMQLLTELGSIFPRPHS